MNPEDLLSLLIEVIGEKRKDKADKAATARKLWVPAINNHGGFGRWAFIEIDDPWDAGNNIHRFLSEREKAYAAAHAGNAATADCGVLMSQHELLWQLVKHLPTDFEPYGSRSRTDDWGPDCSSGCKHFLELAGTLGYDWGVCSNQQSPRAGLLTFEHMGCRFFEEGEEAEQPEAPRDES